MPTIEKPANGVRGCLINVYGETYFRVYHKGKLDENGHVTFTDYKLRHDDLWVVIDDNSATLYDREDDKNTVDYSAEVLGKIPKP